MAKLTDETASRFARAALGHVGREWPNKLDHVIAGAEDVQGPRALHPIFFGSFDWHSCVHGYWLLARLYRRFPELAERTEIRTLFDDRLTAANVAAEVAYLARPHARGFERPYGWAWALMLSGELAQHGTLEGKGWSDLLQPFAGAFVQRFETWLPLATYPVRAGVHANSAFALLLALDYARVTGNVYFGSLLGEKARAWYRDDAACQAAAGLSLAYRARCANAIFRLTAALRFFRGFRVSGEPVASVLPPSSVSRISAIFPSIAKF